MSFWIKKPLDESIMDALIQFEKEDYAKKLKMCITLESMLTKENDLVGFLYDQVIHICK